MSVEKPKSKTLGVLTVGEKVELQGNRSGNVSFTLHCKPERSLFFFFLDTYPEVVENLYVYI